jgi:hypothetical protein
MAKSVVEEAEEEICVGFRSFRTGANALESKKVPTVGV